MAKIKKDYYKSRQINKKPKWLNVSEKSQSRFVSKLVMDLSKYISNDETLTMDRLAEMVLLYQDVKSNEILNIIYSNIFGWLLMYLLNVKRKYSISQRQFEEFFADAYMLLQRCCVNYKHNPSNNTFLSYYRMCIYWIIEHTKLKHKNIMDLMSLSYIDEKFNELNNVEFNNEKHKIKNMIFLSDIFKYIVENFNDKEIRYFIGYLGKNEISESVVYEYLKDDNLKKKLGKILEKKRKFVKNKELEKSIFDRINKHFGIKENE